VAEPARPDGPAWVGLPARFDRRMRLGPFPSVRDALKFATYAAVGAIPAALLAPAWWIPFLGGGFLIAAYHPEGKPVDERAGEFVAYQWRRGPGAREPSKPRRGPAALGPSALVGSSAVVAVLEVAGTPAAFLPPDESRALFDRFREMLRGIDGGIYLVMGTEPISSTPFLPIEALAPVAPDARAGYREMVQILCQRRQRRRVLLAVWVPRGEGAAARLEGAVRVVVDQLGRMGLPAERLADDRLGVTLRRMGWGPGGPA
jgi:hypothetical protein